MKWFTPSCAAYLAIAVALAASLKAAEETPTIIESGNAEMVSTETESTFTFRDGVTVTGTNMKITCSELVVIAFRTGDPKATLGNQERFKSLVATGNVTIVQSDREATCERAEVLPGADKVILSGKPKVRTLDNLYSEQGAIIELHRGERRVIVRGGPGGRTRFTGPALKDLGYDKEEEKSATPESAPPSLKLPGTTTPPQK